jgi:rhodanese-related sulfurtransferase
MHRTVTRHELVERLDGDEPVTLVEALGSAFYADVHLPGAVNIPPDQVDRLAPTVVPDTAAEVVVYSSAGTGESAAMVARRLVALGYDRVSVYPGGKEEWIEHGLPVERP